LFLPFHITSLNCQNIGTRTLRKTPKSLPQRDATG
jgi:hypothetical protein